MAILDLFWGIIDVAPILYFFYLLIGLISEVAKPSKNYKFPDFNNWNFRNPIFKVQQKYPSQNH
jgi:hypothetical protein